MKLLIAFVVLGLTLGQTGDAALGVELAAASDLVVRYQPARLIVDSMFVRPGEAPGPRTSEVRASLRQRALADSLGRIVARSTGRDSLVVRASAPRFTSGEANISVTVVGRLRNRSFYETIAYVLRRNGSRWEIAGRTQLGIT
jgi:hypothetical protein